MKKIYLLLLVITSICAQAQTYTGDGNRPARLAEKIPLDTSYIECIYSHKIYDPVRDENREYFKILEVGHKHSQYSSYGAYWMDSIVKNDYPEGISVAKHSQLVSLASKTKTWSLESLVKDLQSGILKSYDKVFIDHYVYEEPLPQIQWELSDESQEICGYKCNKATGRFRGRNWTAWYSDKIPLNNGPWKFDNLPGLILKIEDDNHEHIFEAVSIRNSDNEFRLIKFHYIKTTREKFNKALSEYKLNPRDFVTGTPILLKNKNGKPIPNNQLFFNPIEKE